MRSYVGICVFCRHALNFRSSPHGAKRFASARQREPYVLPRLVIDLDAADSKLVRRAEEFEDFSPKEPPISRRPEPKTRRSEASVSLQTREVTPPDLLTYALLGDPHAAWNPKTQDLRKIYRYRRLVHEDDVKTKTVRLTSRFIRDDTIRLGHAGFVQRNEKGLMWQLKNSAELGGFSELRRMVSMISSTHEGCSFLAANGSLVTLAIRHCRKSQTPESRRARVSYDMVLGLLNNLRLNMESKGVNIGPQICRTGLYYAAKSWNLAAVRTYLQIASEKSYPPAELAYKALQTLVLRLLYEPEKARGPIGSATVKLITGWDISTKPTTQSRNISFASVLKSTGSDSIFWRAYLVSLAELGLKDALEAEWQADSRYALNNSDWKNDPRLRAEDFALAFLLIGDADYALRILQSIPDNPGESISREPLRPSKPQSAEDDSVTNEDAEVQSPHIGSLKQLFEGHYFYHNLRPDSSLVKALEHAFENLSNDPQQILSTFEKFLVRGYRAEPVETHFPHKKLHWIDGSGLVGLLVMPEEGNTPLYWKSAIPAPE